MAAYALAIIREARFGTEIRTYLEDIDATLAPYDGEFVLHGEENVVLEGSDPGQLVLIRFPSLRQAREWYDSEAYVSIRSLRVENTEGVVVLVEGVGTGHKAIDILSKFRGGLFSAAWTEESLFDRDPVQSR